MNIEDMRHLLEAEPFLGYLGLEVVEARMGAVILRLPLRREVSNHAASVHGGAQYALGEATASALAATLFPERIDQVSLLTASASITYHRLAHGDLTAHAELPADEYEHIRTEFDVRGRVRFSASVALTDADGGVTTTLVVACAARLRS